MSLYKVDIPHIETSTFECLMESQGIGSSPATTPSAIRSPGRLPPFMLPGNWKLESKEHRIFRASAASILLDHCLFAATSLQDIGKLSAEQLNKLGPIAVKRTLEQKGHGNSECGHPLTPGEGAI